MIEQEIKLNLLENIEDKLIDIGAEFVKEELQTNILYDDKFNSLRNVDAILRVRKIVNDENIILTQKLPNNSNSIYKERLEYEEIVDKSIYQKLEDSKLVPVLRYDKKRRIYHFGEKVELAVDTLFSGWAIKKGKKCYTGKIYRNFLEIENKQEPKKEYIMVVMALLNIDLRRAVKKSYPDIIRDYAKYKNGI